MLLKDLLTKAKKKKILFINPLKSEDREDILDDIKERKAIKNPNNAIKQYISKESTAALQN